MSISQSNYSHLVQIVWDVNNVLRSSGMNVDEGRDIVLALFFLKALSDRFKVELEKLKEEHGDFKEEDVELNLDIFTDSCSLIVPKEARFSFLLNSLNSDDYSHLLLSAFRIMEDTNPMLFGVFSDAELQIKRVDSGRVRGNYFKDIISILSEIDLRPDKGINVGIIFIQLIELYASANGKKSGEFYTPQSITLLLTQLLEPTRHEEIYDPACGSGSLLASLSDFAMKNFSGECAVFLYGQEKNISTSNVARMNLILNCPSKHQIETGDTIENPAFLDEGHLKKFDIVVSTPPFSLRMWGEEFAMKDAFGRFKWGVPPKTKGDYAFISHMLSSLKECEGRMAVVVPHGVLFRGAAEGRIRKNIINDNLLDAVIGLPPNLFFGTGIPAAIMIFKKSKVDDRVFFIDASEEYVDGKRQNSLSDENISKIVEIFKTRKEVKAFSRNVSLKEMSDNDFNLNISRYIDDFEEKDDLNLDAELANRYALQKELKALECELDNFLVQLRNKN